MIYHYGTPVHYTRIAGHDLRIKRDDLVCDVANAPRIGKLRAFDRIIRSRPEGVIGVVDRSVHSRASWIAAFVANAEGLGRKVRAYLPAHGPFQQRAIELGAIIRMSERQRGPDEMYRWAEDDFEEWEPSGYLIPDNCHLPPLVDDYAEEVHRTGYRDMDVNDIVIPVGSGGLALGIIQGVIDLGLHPRFHLHMGGSRRTAEYLDAIIRVSGLDGENINIIGPSPSEVAPVSEKYVPPFPANDVYEQRAWRWMIRQLRLNNDFFPGSILFWNAGA